MILRKQVLDLLLLIEIIPRECQFNGLFGLEQRLNSTDCSVALPLPSLNFPNPTTTTLNQSSASFAIDGLIATRLLRDTNERPILATEPCPRPSIHRRQYPGVVSNHAASEASLLQLPTPGVIELGAAGLPKSPYQY